jgi:hypothetical protein
MSDPTRDYEQYKTLTLSLGLKGPGFSLAVIHTDQAQKEKAAPKSGPASFIFVVSA